MKLINKIRTFLKLDSLEELLQRHERLEKSIQAYAVQLDNLVREHKVLKSNFDNQLIKANGDHKYIQERYNNHFEEHVKEVKQIKDSLQPLEVEKAKLLKSNIKLEDEINKSTLKGCITQEMLTESVVTLATGFEKGIISGEVLEEARRNFSQLKKVEKKITIKGQPFILPVYEKIEKATDDTPKQQKKELVSTKMTHCAAKSCEHYKEASDTTNCVLKGVSVSATGGCNQYEPKEDNTGSEEVVEKGKKAVKEATKHEDVLGEGAKERKKLNPKDKVSAVMKEFKQGTLHSGGGEKVTDKKQAIAIALSEAGLSKAAEVLTILMGE